ncbi:MAG: orotidine 5'-phosphate decarboxylase [Geminicoccaceae bacterium]|nr:MAG: orotidine 5'-phosphate decarboxylase [Geminicoccaceae bacterium]
MRAAHAGFPGPVVAAIDRPDLESALGLARRLAGAVGGLKLGLELFVAEGPAAVRALASTGLPIFLDLKLHDIPNTVAGAVRAAAGLGVALLTVHASGGRAMLEAAVEAARAFPTRPRLLAVTVLTSLDADDLAATGVAGGPLEQAVRLARLAREAGLDGMVCSPLEIAAIRAAVGPEPLLVVPGIRPAGATSGDQKRVMSPAAALAAGADLLVVGRPITAAPDPAAAARAITDELAGLARASR